MGRTVALVTPAALSPTRVVGNTFSLVPLVLGMFPAVRKTIQRFMSESPPSERGLRTRWSPLNTVEMDLMLILKIL